VRSQIKPETVPAAASPDILLVDTTGELLRFYARADVIFVGKSLTRHGGQNIIEPAACAKPIVVGPYMENFRAVVSDFLAAEALVQVRSDSELEPALRRLISDADNARRMGEKARQVIVNNRGGLDRTLDRILAE
jgi:3-deoxy-D-manno-octulosonic-acid transferase